MQVVGGGGSGGMQIVSGGGSGGVQIVGDLCLEFLQEHTAKPGTGFHLLVSTNATVIIAISSFNLVLGRLLVSLTFAS